jgi:hypothetical protein
MKPEKKELGRFNCMWSRDDFCWLYIYISIGIKLSRHYKIYFFKSHCSIICNFFNIYHEITFVNIFMNEVYSWVNYVGKSYILLYFSDFFYVFLYNQMRFRVFIYIPLLY